MLKCNTPCTRDVFKGCNSKIKAVFKCFEAKRKDACMFLKAKRHEKRYD